MAATKKEERLLVLCVDRDGDLEAKTKVKTPTLGRKVNLDAATSLALVDPEEADANAMFEALRVYDHLTKHKQPHEDFEIATISGSELLGIEADRKLVRELNQVLSGFPANSVILVTDGYSDESVLPLVESRVPVTSVRRIVIKHSARLEETAAIFTKYLKMLTENPRYARIALGIPGLLLIILLALYLTAGGLWLYYTWIAFLIVLGATLLVKGFGVDRAMARFLRWIQEYEPPPLPVQIAGFGLIAGAISVIVGVFLGVNGAIETLTTASQTPVTWGEWLSILPALTGSFIERGIYLLVIGLCVGLAGRIVRWYFERDIRLLRTTVIMVVIAWSSQIFIQVSSLLIDPTITETELIFTIFIGILIAIASSLLALVANIRYGTFFKKSDRDVEEFSQG